MAKFHPSPTTGKMENCNADPSKPRGRACKFGADDHIEARSLREANAFYEVRLAQEEAESGNAMGSTAVGTGDTVDRAEIEARERVASTKIGDLKNSALTEFMGNGMPLSEAVRTRRTLGEAAARMGRTPRTMAEISADPEALGGAQHYVGDGVFVRACRCGETFPTVGPVTLDGAYNNHVRTCPQARGRSDVAAGIASTVNADAKPASGQESEAAGVKRSAKEAPKKRPIRLTEQEKALREGNKELIKQTLAMRAELGDITFEDANPERAARRLQESIDFADSRGNDNLMNMLRTAKVLPSGAFKTADGRRVNTDRQLLLKSVVDDVDRNRDSISRTLAATFRPGETAKGVFKGDAGSFTVSVAPKLDKDAFEKLPDDVRAACSTEQPVISAERAREVLSADEYDAISSRSQVMNYILAKAKVSGDEKRFFYRGTGNERAAAAAHDLHSIYADTHRERGKVRDLKSELDEGNDAIKSSVAGLGGNVFVPARSQLNGGLVTERVVMNKKKAAELLPKERLDSITVMSPMPDADKARKVLSPEQFATIFEAPTVSIRALESK